MQAWALMPMLPWGFLAWAGDTLGETEYAPYLQS